MDFGIFDHMEQRGTRLGELYEERLQMLEYADANGFVRYHKAEHHFTPLDAAPSSSVFLAAASQRTHRMRLGSLVSLLPFYHPVRLIEEVCALDHLTGGRLDVGIGKGISPIEHRLWGHAAEEAQARTAETIDILRKGLTSDVLTHEGPFHNSIGCRCCFRRYSDRIRRCGIPAMWNSRVPTGCTPSSAARSPR